MKAVKDHYFHKAKQDGFAARSVYKLQEIDQKHKLLKAGLTVLDLGCAPGSWMQYTQDIIGEKGRLIGIDLLPLNVSLAPNSHFFQIDIEKMAWSEVNNIKYDVILSDMAPKTTGIKSMDSLHCHQLCELALKTAQEHLRFQGHLLVKAFQGAEFQGLRKEFQNLFQTVQVCKPQSSRSESVEIFLLGKNLKKAS